MFRFDHNNIPVAGQKINTYFLAPQSKQNDPSDSSKVKPNNSEIDIHIAITDQNTSAPFPDLATVEKKVKEKTNDFSFIFDRKKVELFLTNHCVPLKTEDVLSNKAFVVAMATSLPIITKYEHAADIYTKNQMRKRESKLLEDINVISLKIKNLNDKMNEASGITLELSQGTHNLSLSATQKNSLLSSIAASASEICKNIAENKLIYKINKRSNQQTETRNKDIKEIVKPTLEFSCYNTELAWRKAFYDLECNTIKILSPGITLTDIQDLASEIESEVFINASEIPTTMIEYLLKHFPIIHVVKGSLSCLINVHELVMNTDTFVILFERDISTINGNSSATEKTSKMKDAVQGPKRKTGRKPLHVKYPDLVKIVTDFIKQHSFAAHGRRRETTGSGINNSQPCPQRFISLDI